MLNIYCYQQRKEDIVSKSVAASIELLKKIPLIGFD